MSTFLKNLVRSEGKSCKGKLKFPREDSAERAAAEMTRKRTATGEVFEFYKCWHCDGWHIGHRTNFDWIPQSHFAHRLMLNKYQCLAVTSAYNPKKQPGPDNKIPQDPEDFFACGFVWYTSTVFSTRILTHFPGVIDEEEECLRCPSCKSLKAPEWLGRKWINLEEIDPESIESLDSLWEKATSTLTGLTAYATLKA
jgi:hypothetical protein